MASTVSFSGMASGLDTDAIVEAMVSNYKLKADNSAKQEILLEWKQDIYKDVSKKVYNFYTGIANKLRLESTFNKKLLTTSNTSAIKLDSSSVAPSGTHSLKNLTMATSARMTTYKMKNSSTGKEVTSSTEMKDLGIDLSQKEGLQSDIIITDGDKTTTIRFVDKVTKDMVDSNEIKYIGLNDKISNLNSTLKLAMPSASISFDSNASAFFISSSTTGSDQKFRIKGDVDILQKLGFIETPSSAEDKKEEVTSKESDAVTEKENGVTYVDEKTKAIIRFSGTDAEYTYNDIKMTSKSNNISINGLEFSIISNNTTEEIVVTSSVDTDSIVETLKSFVDEYNTLMKDLNELINAPSVGSYEPLLDEEKEGMTDSQIDKWEKKVKDSLLRNDSTLKNLVSSMRSILSGALSTNKEYKSLSSIGIATTSDWTANGKLELDENKLKEALINNIDDVSALFSANGDGTTAKKGIGDRLYDSLGESFKRIANVKSSTSLFSDTLITKERTNQTKTTNKLQERLENMKEIYLKKFTAMETALSKLNAQTDSLTSLLSS